MPPSTTAALYLDIECRSFSGPLAGLNGQTTLAFSCFELVWAAVTVGYPNLDHLIGAPNQQQMWADTYRIAIIYAFLDSDSSGNIIKSEIYDRADGSEKGAISYYLGLFLAKLTADRLLDVQLLWHFDAYSRNSIDPGTLRTRPDLVGCSWSDAWYVVEAKGRSRGFTSQEAARAKAQARGVSQLLTDQGPRTPRANIVSFAFFNRKGQWKMRWTDPNPESEPEIHLDVGTLLSDYYRPIKLLTDAEIQTMVVSIDDREYFAFFLADVDAWIGAPRPILEGGFRDTEELRGLLAEYLPTRAGQELHTPFVDDGRGRSWHLSSDGIIVRLGERWSFPQHVSSAP